MAATFAPERPTRQIRYRNPFRWRVMPHDDASEQGFYDRSFARKTEAVRYQRRVKAKFPKHPCCLIDTGRWRDCLGRIIH